LEPEVAGREMLNMTGGLTFFGVNIPELLEKHVGGMTNETLKDGTVRQDLAINVMVRKAVGESGILKMKMAMPVLSGKAGPVDDVGVSIMDIEIGGLDSFTEFRVLDPLSKWTQEYAIGMRELSVFASIQGSLISDIPIDIVGSQAELSNLRFNTTVNISLGLKGLGFGAAQLIAFDIGSLKALKTGQVLSEPLCLMTPLVSANLSKLSLSLEDLPLPKISGLIGPGMDALVNELMSALFRLLKAPTLKALPRLADGLGQPK